MTTSESTTRLQDYIKELLPWAHGHQVKSIATFVAAILEKQTGNQAELARTQGNQEAAVKRLSRLIHNERLNPKVFPNGFAEKRSNDCRALAKSGSRLTGRPMMISACWPSLWSLGAGRCRSSGAPMSNPSSKAG